MHFSLRSLRRSTSVIHIYTRARTENECFLISMPIYELHFTYVPSKCMWHVQFFFMRYLMSQEGIRVALEEYTISAKVLYYYHTYGNVQRSVKCRKKYNNNNNNINNSWVNRFTHRAFTKVNRVKRVRLSLYLNRAINYIRSIN